MFRRGESFGYRDHGPRTWGDAGASDLFERGPFPNSLGVALPPYVMVSREHKRIAEMKIIHVDHRDMAHGKGAPPSNSLVGTTWCLRHCRSCQSSQRPWGNMVGLRIRRSCARNKSRESSAGKGSEITPSHRHQHQHPRLRPGSAYGPMYWADAPALASWAHKLRN